MKLLKLATITCMLALTAGAALAQDSRNPDELYRQAREAAFQEEDYTKAIRLARRALDITPYYTGIRVFLGRVYFWSGQHEEARETFLEILEEEPEQLDARVELINVELESSRPRRALELAEQGLEYHSADADLLFRKGRALQELDREEEAIRALQQVRQINPDYPHASALLQQLHRQLYRWQATVSYLHERFSDPFDPWQRGTFELLRETPVGDFIGRVRYDRRFDRTDSQVELDAYPVLSSDYYAYANVGYSPGTFFPDFRAGLTIYRLLPGAFEGSLGLRYLMFSDTNVMIFTGSVSKYIRQYWLAVRPFYSPDLLEGSGFSTQIIIRRFFPDPDNFISLSAGFGSSPDGFNSQQDITRLNSNRIELVAQKKLTYRFLIRGRIGFMREEYRTDAHRNRLIAGLYLYFRF